MDETSLFFFFVFWGIQLGFGELIQNDSHVSYRYETKCNLKYINVKYASSLIYVKQCNNGSECTSEYTCLNAEIHSLQNGFTPINFYLALDDTLDDILKGFCHHG